LRVVDQVTTRVRGTGKDATFFDGLQWRLIGPFRGGRVVAVAGHPTDRRTFYFGSTGGGVWRTGDGGRSWRNVSDGFFRRASVGALAIAASDPNVIYAGMGECCIRSNVAPGDGVYRSDDAGATWSHRGLEDTRHIGRVRVHPTNPELVYVAALGHVHGPNDDRGVYRSDNGGRTWQPVLQPGPDVGAVDLALDPANPRIAYASTWRARRLPWRLDSGGEGSGLWRSTDGGETWADLSQRPGLPRGPLGRIGVSPSPARPGRVWAVVEAERGGVFRSDDYGEHWEALSEQGEMRWRAWYYHHVFAHPTDPETVWVLATDAWRSVDGGGHFDRVPVPHGDTHDLWFDAADPDRLILGDDGGGSVSYDGGVSWSSCYNQPTAELYHVTTDTRTPYRVYACQQDNSSISLPSHSEFGAITTLDYYAVGGGEAGHIAVRPDDPDVVFASEYMGYLTRYDHRRRTSQVISVWPDSTSGAGAEQARYRFNWTSPVLLSPHNPDILYHAGNHVFRSADGGRSWEAVSPDLTRNDPDKLRSSGGSITQDNTGAEYYCCVFALAESPLQPGLLWAGTDDGLVHVTTDGGKSWADVTPPDLPEWSHVSCVEPSVHAADTAYLVADRHRLDDFRPYLWQTRDLGKHWQRLDAGLPGDEVCRVLREDPARADLLYVGTERGVYASFDAGQSWQALQGNLPVTPVHDLVVKDDDLVAATHGRSIWILEDLPAVREHGGQATSTAPHLYTPKTLIRYPSEHHLHDRGSAGSRQYQWAGVAILPYEVRWADEPGVADETKRVLLDAGHNRPDGVTVLYWLDDDPGEVTLTFRDAAGSVIRTVTSARDADPAPAERRPDGDPEAPKEPSAPARPGLNRFVWDTRHEPGTRIERDPPRERGLPEQRGPRVPPGRYEVRLDAGGRQLSTGFEIAEDPRNAAGTDDLQAQYELAKRLWQQTIAVSEAINTIRDLEVQVDRWCPAETDDSTDEIATAARSLREALAEVERDLVPVGAVGSLRLSNPPGLYFRLLDLTDFIEVAARPTESAVALSDELAGEVDQALARLGRITGDRLAEFNGLVGRAGIPPVHPRPGSATT
jgi:photosystem II stability/assembly factor-like uncharacterized protein